ncbi:MAG: hypothetical protein WDO73_33265 [Ignavibacteriota bacterium]
MLFDDGKGNTIYGSQRRYGPRARVVDTAKLAATTPAKTNDDLGSLQPYVDAVENGPDSPVTIDRPATDAMQLHAKFEAGQSLLVQETWGPGMARFDGWQASDHPQRRDELHGGGPSRRRSHGALRIPYATGKSCGLGCDRAHSDCAGRAHDSQGAVA